MASSVSARYGEAAWHKFPNATAADIIIMDKGDGQGPMLMFWNAAIGTQMTETECTAECVLIDAEVTRRDGIRSNSRRAVLKQKLETADAAQIITYLESNITNLATAKDALIDMALLIALDRRD